jgi:hypothetical protein
MAVRLDLDRRLAWLDTLGDQLTFYVKALLWTPRALHRYMREVRRLLAEVAFGSGGRRWRPASWSGCRATTR